VYPTAGTPFSRTRVPLRDWFLVMMQLCSDNADVSAEEIGSQLGITHKTATRMSQIIGAHVQAITPDAAAQIR
jgi:transposase-like protein